jgi:hypothetical protein
MPQLLPSPILQVAHGERPLIRCSRLLLVGSESIARGGFFRCTRDHKSESVTTAVLMHDRFNAGPAFKHLKYFKNYIGFNFSPASTGRNFYSGNN